VDKETEGPELRAEDFIHLQHFAEITKTKGPTLVDAAYAEKLQNIELIAPIEMGKFGSYLDVLVSDAAKAARWLGYVPFKRIVDERNAPPEIFVLSELLPNQGV
jgi:hypothetical protein